MAKPKVGDPGQPCRPQETQGEGICGTKADCADKSGIIKTGRCRGGSDNVCCEAKSTGKPDAAKAEDKAAAKAKQKKLEEEVAAAEAAEAAAAKEEAEAEAAEQKAENEKAKKEAKEKAAAAKKAKEAAAQKAKEAKEAAASGLAKLENAMTKITATQALKEGGKNQQANTYCVSLQLPRISHLTSTHSV